MSEEVQAEVNIDDIVARARAKMRGGARETLPQMSTTEILGTTPAQASEGRAFSSYEDMDAAQSQRKLPAAEENVKTLGDLMAKYRVGEDPDFKALLYRTWPKVFAGGVLAEGYYATYDQPVTEQAIADEFGGGHYRIVVHGPRPGAAQGTKHYASTLLKIAGEPRTDRVPNRGVGAVPTQGFAPVAPVRVDSDTMVDKAFTTLHEVFRDERAERKEQEQRQLNLSQSSRMEAKETMESMSAVYDRLSREVIESERAAHERERKMIEDRAREQEGRLHEAQRKFEQDRRDLEQRQFETAQASSESARQAISAVESTYGRLTKDMIDSERAAHERERQLHEQRVREEAERRRDLEQKYESDRRAAPDPLDMLTRTASLFKGDGDAQQRILDSVLAKHRDEITMFREETARVNDRIREAATNEANAIREASRREVEAERTSAQTRERELLRQIEHERDERRRDADRYREDLLNREQIAKDRLEQQRETINMQWDARHQSLTQQSELRLTYLKDDLDRKAHELDELRSTVREDKDPITQMRKMQEFRESAKDILGITESSSRGIGSESVSTAPPPTSFDFGKVVEGMMEKGPQYLEAIGTLLRGSQAQNQAQAQPPPRPGQILQLPHGTFQVVQTPTGLGMVPFTPPPSQPPVPARLAQPQQPQRALPPPPKAQPRPQHRPQPMPDVDDMLNDEESSAAPLPKAQPAQPRRPRPASAPARSAKPAPSATPQALPVEVAPPAPKPPKLPPEVERQAAQMVGGLLNTAIMQGDEPEDLLANIVGQFPEEMVKIVAQYDVEDILAAIREVQPNSAVFTPGGVAFTRTVFKQLRATVK